MKNNTIHIKNMVCNRCIMVVTEALKRMGFTPLSVELGTAILQEPINAEERAVIKPVLEAYGFELIDDKRMRIIEQIKVAVIELVHYIRPRQTCLIILRISAITITVSLASCFPK